MSLPSPVRVSGEMSGRSVDDLRRSGLRVIAVLGPEGWEPVGADKVLREGEVVLLGSSAGG